MKKITIFIFLIIAINSLNGQNLNGKWLLKEIDSGSGKKGYPGFQLLEINDSIGAFYTDFSLEKKESNLRVFDDKIMTSNDVHFADYKVVNEKHLKLFIEGKSNDKDAIFECDFYRLEPTITTLQKEDIENLTFVMIDNGSEIEFKFSKKHWDKDREEEIKGKEGEIKMIEPIYSTFFVSMFWNGKRNGSIPIKEVSTELLSLYAIPTGPMEIIAYSKK